MNLTILIPTMNRPHYLLRALNYLERVGFKGKVLVGDSSDKETQIPKGNTLVNYLYLPATDYIHDGACMKRMLEEVDTDYAVMQGDDDFLIPNGLQQCVDFLEENKDFSAAHGHRINFYLKDNKLDSAHLMACPEWKQDKPGERWMAYMRNGLSTQAYVHRTDTWREMYENVDKIGSRYLGPELLPCSMTAILGKVRALNCLTYCMQKDTENRQVDWKEKSFWAYMTNPEWVNDLNGVMGFLCKTLIQKEDMPLKDAEEFITREFWLHVSWVLNSHWHNQYSGQKPKLPNHLNDVLRSVKWEHYSDFRSVDLALQ